MNVLSKLWAALVALTANVQALSDTVATINGTVRTQLLLDAPAEPVALEAPETNGRRRKVAAEQP